MTWQTKSTLDKLISVSTKLPIHGSMQRAMLRNIPSGGMSRGGAHWLKFPRLTTKYYHNINITWSYSVHHYVTVFAYLNLKKVKTWVCVFQFIYMHIARPNNNIEIHSLIATIKCYRHLKQLYSEKVSLKSIENMLKLKNVPLKIV